MFVRFCPHPGLALCAHTLLMRSIMKLSWCVRTMLRFQLFLCTLTSVVNAMVTALIVALALTCTYMYMYTPVWSVLAIIIMQLRCVFVCAVAKTIIKVQLGYIVSFESPRLHREATMHTSRVRYSIIRETQSTKMTTVRSAIFEYRTLKS